MSNEKGVTTMEYKYHCQQTAESIANAILPVPENYPLANGLPSDFPEHFSQLCILMKSIYIDMSKRPEAYGLVLTDYALQGLGGSQSKESGLIRKSRNSVNKLSDTLFRLSQSGNVHEHQLLVSLPIFKESIKQAEGNGVSPVSKYELILSRLVDFGFVISNFDGKPFAKALDSFTVEYPDYPKIIDTLKSYCDCWHKIRQSQSALKDRSNLTYKGKPILQYYSHLQYDFRFTADQDKIPMQEWIKYELQSQAYHTKRIDFHIAFYEYSLKYLDVNYDGNYFYKSKRIVKISQNDFSLKLSKMDNYMDEISKMPDSIRKCFAKSNCRRTCGFQGGTEKYCKYRLHWTYENKSHEGCAFNCFAFDDMEKTLVPYYWQLLELEYKLKKY